FLLCDIRDVGSWLGDTTPAEPGAVATRESTKRRLMSAEHFNPTIYLYDSHAGGIGLAERLFEILPDLLRHGLETLHACPCRFGCPSCVGPVNEVGRKAKAPARDPRGLLFLDTEATGLAGGTGTYAFLVGVGHLDGDRVVVAQYFMRDFDEEPALLAALVPLLEQAAGVVTFNGSGFDLPLL